MDNQQQETFIRCYQITQGWTAEKWQVSKDDLKVCKQYVAHQQYLSAGELLFMRKIVVRYYKLDNHLLKRPKLSDSAALNLILSECHTRAIQLKDLHYIKSSGVIMAVLDRVCHQVNDLEIYQRISISRLKRILKDQS